MATMQHPIFSDITKNVPDDQVKAWEQQGWKTKTGKKPASKTAEPKPASKSKR